MLLCPFCDERLTQRTSESWVCTCGESIPFGYERDDEDNCDACAMTDCPRRR